MLEINFMYCDFLWFEKDVALFVLMPFYMLGDLWFEVLGADFLGG
jgi:hypothetical protein